MSSVCERLGRLVAACGLAVMAAAPMAAPVGAQVQPPTSVAAGAGSVSPALAFNILGAEHTVTFTCTNATAGGGAVSAPAGCYGVTGSAEVATFGAGTPIVRGTCAAGSAAPTSSTETCGYIPTGGTATMTINPASPNVYVLTFSGYVPANGGCPAGTGVGATAMTGGAPTPGIITGPGGTPVDGCVFTVLAQKKYVEITGLTPVGGPCGGQLIWSEALKTYVGPSCTVTFVATGTVNIKPVADCSAELQGLLNSASTATLQAEFGPGAYYVCTGNMLGVAGVSLGTYAGMSLPITVNATGLGVSSGVTLGVGGVVYCVAGAAPVTGYTGVPITLCPTDGGTASIGACTGSIGAGISYCSDGTTIGGAVTGAQPVPGSGTGNGSFAQVPLPTAALATPVPETATQVPAVPTATSGATMAAVPFGPGWQQVGGPQGSNFAGGSALYAYDAAAGQYRDATVSAPLLSSAAPLCTGYWMYAASPMTAAIPSTSRAGETATCSLASGWNMVGDPFGSAAALPAGVTGYHWNGASYDSESVIPAGGAAWVYMQGSGSLLLTAQ